MIGTTVGAALDRCFRTYLYRTYARELNALNQRCGVDDDQIVLKRSVAGPAVGGLLAVGNELMQVLDKDNSQTTITVIRGVQGTEQGSYGVGTEVEASPRWARGTLSEEMYQELCSWPDELVREEVVRFSFGASASPLTAFEVTGSRLPVRRVLSVERTARFPITDQRSYEVDWRESRSVFIDGDCWINLPRMPRLGGSYRVVVGTAFDVDPDAWSDHFDLANAGLTVPMIDALVLGATWRMVTGAETLRLQSEAAGESRDVREMPPGAISRLGAELLGLRNQRLNDEIDRITGRWGLM